jgi:hypothetical protein
VDRGGVGPSWIEGRGWWSRGIGPLEDSQNRASIDKNSPRPRGNEEGAMGVLTMNNFGWWGNAIQPTVKETSNGYSSSTGQSFGIGEMQLRVGKGVAQNSGARRAFL